MRGIHAALYPRPVVVLALVVAAVPVRLAYCREYVAAYARLLRRVPAADAACALRAVLA